MDYAGRRRRHGLTPSFFEQFSVLYVTAEQKKLTLLCRIVIVVVTQSRRIVLYTVVWFQCCMLLLEVASPTAWPKKRGVNCVKMLRVAYLLAYLLIIVSF